MSFLPDAPAVSTPTSGEIISRSLSLVEQLHEMAGAGEIGIWGRVSHLHSDHHSVGSRKAQGDGLIDLLKGFGIATDKLKTYSVVETAKGNAERPEFRKLLARIRRGEIRVVVCLFADRLARNAPDAEELYAALASVNGLVIIGGQIHDPSDHNQLLFLRLQALIAQQENAQRTLRFLISRATLARDGHLMIALPAGLVWADPTDAAYREAAKKAKLLDEVNSKLGRHHCSFTTPEGRTRRILPWPDANVNKAVRLRHQALIETRDLRAVFDFIANDPAWPKPGFMPVAEKFLYRPHLKPAWTPLGRFRDDGKAESLLRQLRSALGQPALFGTYAWEPENLTFVPRNLRHLVTAVEKEGAFPSYFPPEELAVVREILEPRTRPHKRRRANEGPDERPFRLPVVRCAHRLKNGQVCGAVLAPWLEHFPKYQSGACTQRDHQGEVPMERLDDLVLDVVRAAYRPDALEPVLATLRARASAPEQRIRELRQEHERLEADVRYYFDQHETARRANDEANRKEWGEHHMTAVRERDEAKRRLDAAERGAKEDQGLTRAEEARARTVAARLDELLPLAVAHPAAVRELMAVLVRAVHVRRVGQSAHVVEVEFPGGARSRHLLIARRFVASQPELLYATLRLRPYLDDELEDRLRMPAERGRAQDAARLASIEMNATTGATVTKTEWTASRVWTAAWAARMTSLPPGRVGPQSPLQALARIVGEPEAAVLGAALLGRLGPATLVADALALCPEEAELHDVFPDYARRAVAARAGWPVRDVVPLIALARDVGIHPTTLRGRLDRAGGLGQDAAGRLYGRRSVAAQGVRRPPSLEDTLAVAPEALRALDPAHWRSLRDACAELPGVRPEILYRYAPTVGAAVRGPAGSTRVWVWLAPEVRDSVVRRRRRTRAATQPEHEDTSAGPH